MLYFINSEQKIPFYYDTKINFVNSSQHLFFNKIYSHINESKIETQFLLAKNDISKAGHITS